MQQIYAIIACFAKIIYAIIAHLICSMGLVYFHIDFPFCLLLTLPTAKARFFATLLIRDRNLEQTKKRKQFIYDVLSEQLDKAVKALEELGFRFGLTAIIGEEMVDDKIAVYEAELRNATDKGAGLFGS